MRAATMAAVLGVALLATSAGAVEICGRCHQTEAALEASTGGHAPDVSCETCHRDRRPGRFGAHHRAIPTCTTHHDEGRHPPRARPQGARRTTRNCLACHDPHGSTNAHLVRAAILARRFRLVSVHFVSEAGAAPGGFTDPAAPGAGVCEVCHRKTDFYRADGHDKSHFTESCILCHEHAASFRPVASEKNCTICHTAEGERFAKGNLHSANFVCTDCHAEASAEIGPGHRRKPECAECHTNATHAPPGYAPFPCTQCHDPHGTDNHYLVLDEIMTTQAPMRPIRFDNLFGRVDGSFASASAPGTGICEVCHTTTRFYRADGSGEPHFTFSCLPCHLHGDGFSPQ